MDSFGPQEGKAETLGKDFRAISIEIWSKVMGMSCFPQKEVY